MAARATITVVSAVADVGTTTEATLTSNYIEVEVVAYIDLSSDNQWFYETIPLGDVRFNTVEKNLTDITTLTDDDYFDFEKNTTETLAFAEDFARVVSYNRSFTDAFTLDDLSQIDKDFYGNKGNIFGFTDILGLSYSKTETDSYTVSDVLSLVNSFVRSFPEAITISDTDSKDFSKETPDNFSALDEHINSFEKNETETLALSQDISLSQGKNETEVIPLSDAINALFSKNITDGFTLDDAALVNKDYFGNKGNILGFSDVLSRAVEYNRAYADNLSFVDNKSFTLSRTIYDEVRVRDTGYTSNALGTNLFNNNQINYTSPDNNVEDVSLTIDSSKPESLGFSDITSMGNIKSLTESFTFSDVKGLQLEKTLSDGFALDDSTLIDKDYFGNKGNIVGISDYITIDYRSGGLLGHSPLNTTSLN